jgi:hypothetical protein
MNVFDLTVGQEIIFESRDAMTEFVQAVHGRDGVRLTVFSHNGVLVSEAPAAPVPAEAPAEAVKAPAPKKPRGRPKKVVEES